MRLCRLSRRQSGRLFHQSQAYDFRSLGIWDSRGPGGNCSGGDDLVNERQTALDNSAVTEFVGNSPCQSRSRRKTRQPDVSQFSTASRRSVA